MSGNFYSEQHKLKNYETDFKREIKPSALLGFFQEAAGANSEEMGLGFDDLKASGMFWVLSKMSVEILALPHFKDDIIVETWPHSPNKAIFERSFRIKDASGNIMVNAFSRWCILREGGRIVPASSVKNTIPSYIEERAVTSEFFTPVSIVGAEPVFKLKIANSEYDLNGHVNNIKYADYIFNCFSVEELRSRVLKSFQIHYVKQSYEGDVLRFYRQEQGNGVFLLEGVKNDEEVVVTARVCFGQDCL